MGEEGAGLWKLGVKMVKMAKNGLVCSGPGRAAGGQAAAPHRRWRVRLQ